MTTEQNAPVKIKKQKSDSSGSEEPTSTDLKDVTTLESKESTSTAPEDAITPESKKSTSPDPEEATALEPKDSTSTDSVGATIPESKESTSPEPEDTTTPEIKESKSTDPEKTTASEVDVPEKTDQVDPNSIDSGEASKTKSTKPAKPEDQKPEASVQKKTDVKAHKKSRKSGSKSSSKKKAKKPSPIQLDDGIRKFFSKDIEVASLDRRTLIKAIITRHTMEIEPLRKELKELKSTMSELQNLVNHSRKERDEVNTSVMDLKQTRRVLHDLANEKRREFFMLIEKLDDLEKIDHEIEDFQGKLDKMDWEIQTTKITSDDEKVIIKKMKEIYHRMSEANVEAQKKLGIEEKVKQLSAEIGDNLAGAQKRHEELLGKAKESDLHHDEYIVKGKQLSELRIQVRRVDRRIKSHKESLQYWKEWVGGNHA